MTDRELLEAAAQAAGITFAWINNDGARKDRKPGILQPYVRWNPLTDDGDALRLAVKLSLRVDAGYCGCADVRGYMVDATEALGHDACAATRRAIVRAAAEIYFNKGN